MEFNLRIPTARPLTPAEHDENFENINTIFSGGGSATLDDAQRVMALFLQPASVVAMFSGAIASIPTGWVLCDGGAYSTSLGSGNVIDLTNRFIVAADADDGGVAKTTIDGIAAVQDHTASAHNHNSTPVTLTAAQSGIGIHSHPLGVDYPDSSGTNFLDFSTTGECPPGSPATDNFELIWGDSDGCKTTNKVFTENNSAASSASESHDHPNIEATVASTHPTFYALAFITYVGV